MEFAIWAEGLRKRYKRHDALSGVNLSASQGTVLGLLGPNGAGKTTTVRILATLLEPDAGHAVVGGFDVRRQPTKVRQVIGLAGQYASVDEVLTGRENLTLLGTLLHLGRRRARERAAELLDAFSLTDVADRPVGTYSGGMRRRLDLAACIIGSPSVLFLDEPTTGLDPNSRMRLWAMIREQVSDGVTALLSTQYLEEADHLADQIVVIDSGCVIAEGTPEQLKRKVGKDRLEVSVAHPGGLSAAVTALTSVGAGAPTVDTHRNSVSIPLQDGIGGFAAAADALLTAGLDVADFKLRRPSLDDVFFSLTGQSAGEREKA
jgi:ABC-2 type transport system ATP-binding protein